MESDEKLKKFWFRRKRYGYGWTPVTWQGWFALGIYVGSLVVIFLRVDRRSHSNSDTLIGFALPFIAISLLFMWLCRNKGESLRWQWGKEKHR